MKCIHCPRDAGRGTMCRSCRAHFLGLNKRKYFWKKEDEDLLRRLYADASSRSQVSKAITAIVRRTGFPRHIVRFQAQNLGISTRAPIRPWTGKEVAVIRELAGRYSTAHIAKKVRRSSASIGHKAREIGIQLFRTEGYSALQISELLGVSQTTVLKWIDLGWLKRREGRITEENVKKFLQQHPHVYVLRRVDEPWFKGVLFPAFNIVDHARFE